uniref:Uncharacterized protein n=1 Tax=viral metagenome TaxID=1070528 RepID=A0A6M3LV61_9ZZZZ
MGYGDDNKVTFEYLVEENKLLKLQIKHFVEIIEKFGIGEKDKNETNEET